MGKRGVESPTVPPITRARTTVSSPTLSRRLTASPKIAVAAELPRVHSEGNLKFYSHLHVPDYLREMHVFSGYRKPGQTYTQCIKSIFSLHNETLNAWTHFLGFLFFVFLAIYTFQHMPDSVPHSATAIMAFTSQLAHNVSQETENCINELKDHLDVENAWHQFKDKAVELERKSMSKLREWNLKLRQETNDLVSNSNGMFQDLKENANQFFSLNSQEKFTLTREMIESKVRQLCEFYVPSKTSSGFKIVRWPIFVYLGCVCTTLLMSALFHTFACHERETYAFFLRLDCSGIALQIAASIYPIIFYPFQENTFWQVFYLGLVTLSAVALFICSLFEWFEKWRKLRAFLFVSMGAVGALPVLHLNYFLAATNPAQVQFLLQNGLITAGLYLVGTTFFVTRIPERFFPGKFDIWFHSHQLWHIMVIVGALWQYSFAIKLAQVRFTWPG